MDEQLLKILACPICKQAITRVDVGLKCTNNQCSEEFPIVNGKPVLLNERSSIFATARVAEQAKDDKKSYGFRNIVTSIVPSITHNWVGRRNFAKLAALLSEKNTSMTVLVIGAGEIGVGFEELIKAGSIRLIETDVCFGARTQLLADAHDLPFLDESFDAVIVQAVLEHVLDPSRCVNEAHRVLKEGGFIYAETPFMYPVHLGPYDFTRFSLSGHRLLMRRFSEVDSGVASGAGQGLAVALRSFMLSLSTAAIVQAIATVILPFFTFWLKYCDYFFVGKPHAADFASTLFFFGVKGSEAISDVDIVNYHWSKRRSFVRSSAA